MTDEGKITEAAGDDGLGARQWQSVYGIGGEPGLAGLLGKSEASSWSGRSPRSWRQAMME